MVSFNFLRKLYLILPLVMVNLANEKISLSRKKGFCFSCKSSPKETIYIKCQTLFSGKKDENCEYFY